MNKLFDLLFTILYLQKWLSDTEFIFLKFSTNANFRSFSIQEHKLKSRQTLENSKYSCQS